MSLLHFGHRIASGAPVLVQQPVAARVFPYSIATRPGEEQCAGQKQEVQLALNIHCTMLVEADRKRQDYKYDDHRNDDRYGGKPREHAQDNQYRR